ncbi:MAG: chromosomal replication initiator protein DnaA, partial [Chloroflexi bacterium]
MKPEQIWQAALGELQLQMTPAMFDTWLRGSRVLAHEEGLFVVGVASGYTKDWLERRLHATIARTLTGIVGRTVEVRFSVSGNDAPPAELLVGAKVFVPAAEVEMPETPSLNPRYNFDNFVVGAHNRMAHAAARAVSESPAGAYNPLFLHGGVGLGKTHLLQAIG